MAPWPANCMIYQHDDICWKYEISRDGKSVDSCDRKKDCEKKETAPICLQEYPPRNYSLPLFPDLGQQCFFRESLYPIKPWEKGCKIFQADNKCHSYEVSDEGNYINSCDLSMVYDECLASVTKKNICLEYCPEFNCIREELGKYLTLSLYFTLSVIYISYA